MERCHRASWRDTAAGGAQSQGTAQFSTSVTQNLLMSLGNSPQGVRKSCWRVWLLLPPSPSHGLSSWQECQECPCPAAGLQEADRPIPPGPWTRDLGSFHVPSLCPSPLCCQKRIEEKMAQAILASSSNSSGPEVPFLIPFPFSGR